MTEAGKWIRNGHPAPHGAVRSVTPFGTGQGRTLTLDSKTLSDSTRTRELSDEIHDKIATVYRTQNDNYYLSRAYKDSKSLYVLLKEPSKRFVLSISFGAR